MPRTANLLLPVEIVAPFNLIVNDAPEHVYMANIEKLRTPQRSPDPHLIKKTCRSRKSCQFRGDGFICSHFGSSAMDESASELHTAPYVCLLVAVQSHPPYQCSVFYLSPRGAFPCSTIPSMSVWLSIHVSAAARCITNTVSRYFATPGELRQLFFTTRSRKHTLLSCT